MTKKKQSAEERVKRAEEAEQLLAHENRVRNALEKVFPNVSLSYIENRKDSSVNIDLRTYSSAPSVTFDKLRRVSNMFGGTKKIDITGGSEATGYCETCSGSEDFVLIRVQSVDFNKIDLDAATADLADD